MPKITPFLWFDDQAEEAARFYVSVFRRSKIGEGDEIAVGDEVSLVAGRACVGPSFA